ncbi:restriction endonuclease [Pontibacterium sp. N1Y112]|uniref:Restriction endonuclease n=1 Tax=Pontibacterium sinense TaxID=2781979 RepID=A0A8J7F637_9GAMM|nr:restriction endonuclease [Pontibacterium sinense]MBE9395740.1 restriction endonuclease [Pontibacterium sinense]
MARKRRTSPLEDLVEIASILPYWASLIIAVVCYMLFHHYATSELDLAVKQGSANPYDMSGMLFKAVASALQYIVPMAFVIGAAVSGLKAFRGRKLAEYYVSTPTQNTPRTEAHSTPGDTSKPTDSMSWTQFELLVGHAFRQLGYSVIDGGESGADGGVDVHLRKDGHAYLVQCKHWKTKSVGVSVVRELYGVIAGDGARGGFVVTSGYFTEEAKAFASGKRIGLIDGVKLDKMIRYAKKSVPDDALRQVESAPGSPSCPKCSSVMVKRKARQGQHAGLEFWGCSQFPKCRGIKAS